MMIPDDSMTSPSLREMLLQKELQKIPEKYVESEENNLTQEVQGAGRRFQDCTTPRRLMKDFSW